MGRWQCRTDACPRRQGSGLRRVRDDCRSSRPGRPDRRDCPCRRAVRARRRSDPARNCPMTRDLNDALREEGESAVRAAIDAAAANPYQSKAKPNGHAAGGSIDGAAILDGVHAFLGWFVAYPSEDAHIAHTLWIAHCHLMDAWESTPRIAFLSPEPSSGKTRALEASELLVPNPV